MKYALIAATLALVLLASGAAAYQLPEVRFDIDDLFWWMLSGSLNITADHINANSANITILSAINETVININSTGNVTAPNIIGNLWGWWNGSANLSQWTLGEIGKANKTNESYVTWARWNITNTTYALNATLASMAWNATNETYFHGNKDANTTGWGNFTKGLISSGPGILSTLVVGTGALPSLTAGYAMADRLYFKEPSGTQDVYLYNPGYNDALSFIVGGSTRLSVGTTYFDVMVPISIYDTGSGAATTNIWNAYKRKGTGYPTSGQELMSLQSQTWNGTGATNKVAGALVFVADENQNVTSRATRAELRLTPTGATTPTTYWTFDSDGTLMSGTAGTSDYDITTAGAGSFRLLQTGTSNYIQLGNNVFDSNYAYQDGGLKMSIGSIPAGFFIESNGGNTGILEMAINSLHFNNRNTNYPGATFHLDARGEFGRFHVYTYDPDGTEHEPLKIGEDNEVYMTTFHADKSYITISDPEIEVLSPITPQRAANLLAYIPKEKMGVVLFTDGNKLYAAKDGDYYEVPLTLVGKLPKPTVPVPETKTSYYWDSFANSTKIITKPIASVPYPLPTEKYIDQQTGEVKDTPTKKAK